MNIPERYCYYCMARLSEPGQVCPECGYDNANRDPGTGNLPPMLLGNQYVVGRALGQGGFGVTYIGWDINLECKVAIKEYRPTELTTRSERATSLVAYSGQEDAFEYGKQRALHEGRTMAKMVSLPNVVKIYNAFEANNTVYIIMEYIDGMTLSGMVRKEPGGKIAWKRAYELFRPLMLVLHEVHKKGIIHRDISPDNIMIRYEDGKLVLLDFGAAKNYVDNPTGSTRTSTTKEGYSPVEQYVRHSTLDNRSDEYALCATMYFAITGTEPACSFMRSVEQVVAPHLIHALRRHPHVVHVKFMFKENGTAYYGMDMLEGKNIFGWMRERGMQKVTAKQACELLNPIMDALAFCHRTGVLHRDVSPDNIFIAQDSQNPGNIRPVLIDFGAAYVAIDNFTHTFPNVQKRGYSPIEQMTRQGGGTYSDVYALCATFYHLITGSCPPSAMDTIITPIKPPSQMGADIPMAAENVLMQGLARSYTERIQTVGELQRRLCSTLGVTPYHADVAGPSTIPPPPPQPQPVPKPNVTPNVSGSKMSGSYASKDVSQASIGVSQVSGPGRVAVSEVARENNTGKRVIGYLLECLLFFLPCILFAGGWGVLAGYLIMTLLDAVLCMMPTHGTLGMKMFGLTFENDENITAVSSLLYSMLYALIPFTLIDGLIALPGGADMCTIREKVTGMRIGAPGMEAEVSMPVEDASYSGSAAVNPAAVKQAVNRTPAAYAMLKGKDGPLVGREFRVESGFAMGRNSDMCEIVLDTNDMNVSRCHCRFQFKNQQWMMKNESSNGTYVDGTLLEKGEVTSLKSGTLLKVGKSTFVFLASLK